MKDDSTLREAPRILLVLIEGRKISSTILSNTTLKICGMPEKQQDLWNADLGGCCAVVLDPLRDYILDPLSAVSTTILPPLATALPILEPVVYHVINGILYVQRCVYVVPRKNFDLRRTARNDLIVNSKAAAARSALPKFRPPSDLTSAFRGSVAFCVSALADVSSVAMDNGKMQKWFGTLREFQAYLYASGVAGELDDAMYKPLVRGRLLDNLKLLSDVQQDLYADRPERLRTFTDAEIRGPLIEGKRMMRFATAAYGTEMIRSALDREAHPEELSNHMRAIAFHCNIDPEDIRILFVNDGGDMKVLRHFVAIDRNTASVVLALRGTLSISGALVDMQAMDTDFCGGKAHKGMADMANNIWEESGDKIVQLFKNEPELEHFSFTIVGHSLGAGTACLMNVKCHAEKLLGEERHVRCYGFAPPPTLCMSTDSEASLSIQKAIDHTICYVHDNDCVPFLSVSAVRRLAGLMRSVDNRTEHFWALKRWRMFWKFEDIPQELIDDVHIAEAETGRDVDGASRLVIPTRMVVWMKLNVVTGSYEGFGVDPEALADLNIFCCQDMVTDHLVEPYENALDELAA